MEPKGEVGKPVSGATPLSKRGGFFHVLAEGGILNHLRSRRADSTSAGARLVNTLFGEVNKKTLIDAPEPSPTPKTEFTELSLRPPKDRLNRERRPDFDKVYPDMSKWLIQRLKNVVEIQKTNPQMCEKGGVLANEYLLAQAMIGDAGTIAEVKVKEYFKDPQAYATTITMIEDSLATLAFSQGKYIQRNQTDGITLFGRQIGGRDTRQGVNPDATTTPLGERGRDALPALVRMVVAGGAGAVFAGTPVINRIALALGAAITAAANPGSAVESAVSGALAGAAAGAAIGSGLEMRAQLSNQDGGNHIRKLQDALTAVRTTPGAEAAVKAMYGIDPANIEFNGDRIEFVDGNTDSPAWKAAQEQLTYLARIRKEYYCNVHRLNPLQIDGMPEQYLADSDDNTNLMAEQSGSRAMADIQDKFKRKIDALGGMTNPGVTREVRLKLMTEARREWLGERMNAQFDKSSLKKDAAKRAREKVMISTQIDKLKKGTGTPPVEGETRKSAKAAASEKVKLYESLSSSDLKTEADSLVAYLQPVEAIKMKRRELQNLATKYAGHPLTTSSDCLALANLIREYINLPGTSTLFTPARDTLTQVNKEAQSEAHTRASTDKTDAMATLAKDPKALSARLTAIDATLARSLEDIRLKFDSDRAQFDSDITALHTAAASIDAEMTKLSEFGKEARAIKSAETNLKGVRKVGTTTPPAPHIERAVVGGPAINIEGTRLGLTPDELLNFGKQVGATNYTFEYLMSLTYTGLIPDTERSRPEHRNELIRAIADAKAEAGITAALNEVPAAARADFEAVTTNLGYELLGLTDAEAISKSGLATAPTEANIKLFRKAMEGVLQARNKAYKETLAIVEYQKKQAEANVLNVDTDCDAKEKAYEIIRNRFLEADRGKASYEIATKMVRDFATMFDARLLPTAGVDFDGLTQAERAAAAGLPERSITNLLEAIFKYKDAPENSTIKDPSESFRAVNAALGGGLMLPTVVEIFVRDLNLAAALPLPPPPPTYVAMMNAVRAQNLVTAYTVPQMQKVVSGIINHVCEKATLGNI